MSPDDTRKQKDRPEKPAWKHALEGAVERLREGLDELTQGLRPQRQQPVPIPVPTRRPRK